MREKDLPYEEKRKIQGKFFSFSSFAAAFVVLFIAVREKERERKNERMSMIDGFLYIFIYLFATKNKKKHLMHSLIPRDIVTNIVVVNTYFVYRKLCLFYKDRHRQIR